MSRYLAKTVKGLKDYGQLPMTEVTSFRSVEEDSKDRDDESQYTLKYDFITGNLNYFKLRG